SPGATLVTGITPQRALAEGVNEAAAFARIFEEMARPKTCTLGYNSLRFDDEFVRCGLFRSFYDPYEREWKAGNCRWDLLDVMRLAHALRPEGIAWPKREDGATSFRLEHLAEANGVREGQAHEALSDVRALIGLARRLREAQPRLWEYALSLRHQRRAAQLLDPIWLAHALRPEGIAWPKREDGATSFRLEHLAEANGVREGQAHEALSDVRALIGLARRLREAQPRLWEYALSLRDKRRAAQLLDPIAMQPALHVSQRYPAARLCAAAVLPLARHPGIDGRMLVFDLDGDPELLLGLDAETIASRLYVRREELAEGEERVPLKEVHL